MHLKLVARIENIMLARRCQLWSLAVNVDLFDNSKAFSLVKEKGTQKSVTICMCFTYSTFRSKHQTLYDQKKMKELFWNIKLDCRSKQIIMDFVTLRGLIHVYIHVPCLVAQVQINFSSLHVCFIQTYGCLRISVNCTAR